MSRFRLRASSSAMTIFFEPPLVEIATATSSGRAWAINWRRKINSVPTSLAMAEIFAGSMESEIAGTAARPGGGMTQSIAQSLASVAEPPLPKIISLPPRATRSRIAAAALLIFSDSSCATRARSSASSCAFIRMEAATCATMSDVSCFSFPRNG